MSLIQALAVFMLMGQPGIDLESLLGDLTMYARTGACRGDPGRIIAELLPLGGEDARMAAWAAWSAGEPLPIGSEPWLLEFGAGEPTPEMLGASAPAASVESLMLRVLHALSAGEQPSLPAVVDSLVRREMPGLPEGTARLALQVYGRLGLGGLGTDPAAGSGLQAPILRYFAETGTVAHLDHPERLDPLARIYAARALPLDELGPLGSDPLWAVRYEVAGRIEPAGLHAFLADPEPFVALRAASRMREAGIEGYEGALAALAGVPGPVGHQAAAMLDSSAAEVLSTLLESEESGRRLSALQVWLESDLPVSPEMLTGLLQDPYWLVPVVYLEDLAAEDSTQARERATRLLSTSDDRDLRQALAGFLGITLPEGDVTVDLPAGLAEFKSVDRVTIRTGLGDIGLMLFTGDAPVTCQTFCWLASHGFYDGLYFHRVIPGFVAQAGCPQGNGMGGPGFQLPSERNLVRFRRGIVGMADAGLDTGGSQFFIMLDDHDRLDCRYTAFAVVTGSDSILDRITVGTRIESVSLQAPGD